jgi:hypothetical protein
MNRSSVLFVALLAMLTTASARAACIYPEAPTSVPNGATATYEEMANAHHVIVEFDTDIRHFTICLEMEAERLLKDPDLAEEVKRDLQQQLASINDIAVEHAEFVAGQFNEQLRIFRERDDQ